MSAIPAAVSRRSSAPEYDFVLIWLTLVLLAFGVVMVYSASIDMAEASRRTGHHADYFLLRQALFVIVGLFVGWLTFKVPMRHWQHWKIWRNHILFQIYDNRKNALCPTLRNC